MTGEPGSPDEAPADDVSADWPPEIAAALSGLEVLRPDRATAGEAMPAEVWARLTATLAAEAAARTSPVAPSVAPVPAEVVALDAERAARRGSRGLRWAGGLVAAGIVVVAGGIVVTNLAATGGEPVVVADVAAPPSADKAEEASPEALAGGAAGGALPEAAALPPADGDAGAAAGTDTRTTVAPAARVVTASNTDYAKRTLRTQVVDLVKASGFATPELAATMTPAVPVLPVDTGFTASWEALRNCLTYLTASDHVTALVVDRGTYDGAPAGVIVAPDLPSGAAAAEPDTPSPTATLATPMGIFDIWVVNAECDDVSASLDDFALYAWRP